MPKALIWVTLICLASLLSFWLGRSVERTIWAPGQGLHLVSLTGGETYWTIRSDTSGEVSSSLVGWSDLTRDQRQTVLYCDRPPQSISHAKDFLFEVTDDGVMIGRVGPESQGGRFSLSFDREGGYDPKG